MYWAIDGDLTAIVPNRRNYWFSSICLETNPVSTGECFSALEPRPSLGAPWLEDAVVNAKAGCLYPNNARMLVEARSKGFNNALVTDAMGNVGRNSYCKYLHGKKMEKYLRQSQMVRFSPVLPD